MIIEWINNGQEFELPKINIAMELEILGYLEQNTKDMSTAQKNYLEFIETIYHVLYVVDKNITRELIKDKLSASELGVLFVAVRTKGNVKYSCPHCKKQFTYNEMNKAEGETNFRKSPLKDITGMKEETLKT